MKPIWGRRRGPNLPAVIPGVVCHGQRSWPCDPKFSKVFPPKAEAFRRFFPDFEIVLADRSQYPDEEIRGAVRTRAFLLMLKHVRSPDFPDWLPGIFRLFGELSRSKTGLGHLEAMLRCMARAAENTTPETVETLVEKHFAPNEGEKLMATLAEQWERRGGARGILRGRQEVIWGIFQKLNPAGLDVKFGGAALSLMPFIQEIQAPERLRALPKGMWTATDLGEFRKQIQEG